MNQLFGITREYYYFAVVFSQFDKQKALENLDKAKSLLEGLKNILDIGILFQIKLKSRLNTSEVQQGTESDPLLDFHLPA